MAGKELDPNKASGQLEFHDLMLKEVRVGMENVRNEVVNSRLETAKLVTRLDEHIDTCDKRQTLWGGRWDALCPRACCAKPCR